MSALIDYLPSLTSNQPEPPELIDSDDVIPVHLFDDSAAARGIVLVWTYRFNDILDPDKLYIALSQLFRMAGWRKFSGRFRYRTDGDLEIHVPQTFTAERPAVYFTKECHDVPMTEHPLAAKLPRPNGKIATYPGPRELCPLGLGPETPRTIDEFISSGMPQFCLHVQTFTDGTLVSLTHSHISTDLMGLASILEAWSLVLAGKPDAVPPMVGYHDDAFDALRHPSPEQHHVLGDKVLDGWRLKYWGLRSLYDTWRCSDIESRILCVPGQTMENILQEARSHLGDASELDEPFISEGDVLTAIACRIMAQYHGPTSGRELATIMALDPRSRAKSVFRDDAAYIQNSPTNIFFSFRADQALELPLGQLALLVREAIATQAAEDQLKAVASLSEESMKATKMPVMFGDKDMATQFMSNWTKGELANKMDFSPAVVQEASQVDENSKRGHPVYYQASDPSHNAVSVISSLFVVVQKDYDGNIWFSNSLPGKMWSDLIEYLEQFT